MTFLYLGLGIAMISGISAMMRIGNNVSNLMFLSTFKETKYDLSSLPNSDRYIMRFLNNYSGPDSEVCSKLKEDSKYNSYNYPGTTSPNPFFKRDYCVLDYRNPNEGHRVLIETKKNDTQSFNLFSCYLTYNTVEDSFCPFEIEIDK